MELSMALEWASDRRNATLITIRADGRPQSSDIAYLVDDGAFVISVTRDRAKTRNMVRDPRIVLHISEPSRWSYASFDGTVELSPVATRLDDATNDQLVDYYRAVAGQDHPDWNEYRRAMVADRRLLLELHPTHAYGMLGR